MRAMFFTWVATVLGTELVANECALKEGMNETVSSLEAEYRVSPSLSPSVYAAPSQTLSI